MRRKIAIVLLLSAISFTQISTTAFADTLSTQQETAEENTSSTQIQESDNNDSKAASSETTEDLEPGTTIPDLTEEEEQRLDEEAQAALQDSSTEDDKLYESLTEEQKEAGYQVVDGKIYSPAELNQISGNADDVNYDGAVPGEHTGYVRFHALVPDTVHETVYVEVINMNTTAMFGTRMYEINNYESTLCLPAGKYCVTSGGLEKDVKGDYGVYNQYFTVYSGTNATVIFTVRDFKNEAEKEKELSDQVEAQEKANEEAREQEINQTSTESVSSSESGQTETSTAAASSTLIAKRNSAQLISYIILTAIFTVIPIAILIYYLQKKKGNGRGFED